MRSIFRRLRLLTLLIPVALGLWVLHATRISEEQNQYFPGELESADESRLFSATQANETLKEALATDRDFLSLYLLSHFPAQVTEGQLLNLRENMKASSQHSDRPSQNYRYAFSCFFVALAETQRLSRNLPEDPAMVAKHWDESVTAFRRSKDLGLTMVQELDKILRNADKNNDGLYTGDELASIIGERVSR